MYIAYDPKHIEFYGRIRAAIKDPVKLMKQIGILVLASAQRHFKEESFGGQKWPARMSKQREPKINYAGAISDWAAGRTVSSRRFKDRPALKDTGALRDSLSVQKANQSVHLWDRYTVEVGVWGPPAKYAGLHQTGGISIIAVTRTAKEGMSKFLSTSKGKKFGSKLGVLFRKSKIEVKVPKRPFLGIDHALAADVKHLVEETLSHDHS